MMMKRKAASLLLIILLISLFQGPAAAENGRPAFVGKNVQETKLSFPTKLNDDYDLFQIIPIVSNSQDLPFVLIRAWNRGTQDGMVDLWLVQSEEITFLDSIRGDARSNAVSSIAYKDDTNIAFFHVGRGGLWKIDGSTKEVKLVMNGLGTIRNLSVTNNGSLYFTAQGLKELWTSDWSKEGTLLVQAFEDSLLLVNAVTDGIVLQAPNSTMYFVDDSDRSTTALEGIKIAVCSPSDVAAIPGDNGSKALIKANGLWSIGRHPPKRLTEDYWWIRYIGPLNNELLLNVYNGGSSSFQLTDGEGLRPINMPPDATSPRSGSRFFGPFANNANSIFKGNSFFTVNSDADDANTGELVSTLSDPNPLTGFLSLLKENKVLIRSVSKLWEFDAATNEVRLLVDWDEKVYIEPESGRDRTWDTFFAFRDGTVLMPMRKIAQNNRYPPTYSQLEFWSIQLNANTEEYNAYPVTSAPTTSPTLDVASDITPTNVASDATPTSEPKLDESSSSMVCMVVAPFATTFLLVLLGNLM